MNFNPNFEFVCYENPVVPGFRLFSLALLHCNIRYVLCVVDNSLFCCVYMPGVDSDYSGGMHCGVKWPCYLGSEQTGGDI